VPFIYYDLLIKKLPPGEVWQILHIGNNTTIEK